LWKEVKIEEKRRKKGEYEKRKGMGWETMTPIRYATGSGKPFAAFGSSGDLPGLRFF